MSEMRYALVTGGNAGIGFETVKELCKLGYFVTITTRSFDKGEDAKVAVLKEVPSAQVDHLVMELKDLSSVKAAALHYLSLQRPLHLLINNAGIMNVPFERTVDGFESQFQVNHLGHFLFVHHLLPLLRQSGGGRVVNLSSRAHMRWNAPLNVDEMATESPESYDGLGVYGRSKLCNIYFSKSLAKRFPVQDGVTFNSLHPGLVDTKLLNTVSGLSSQAIPVSEGCKCSLYVATSAEVEGVSGQYFHESKVATDPNLISRIAASDEEAEKLWSLSLKLVGIKEEDYGL